MQDKVVGAERPGVVPGWWRAMRAAAVLLMAVLLAGCEIGTMFSGRTQAPQPEPDLPQAAPSAPRVALIVPLTGQGETQRIGAALKQAAELAMFDAENPGITLISKDSGGSPEGAAAAARAAIDEGADIILGPLLASEVQAVSPIARSANVPVVAFSTVSEVAAPGVYLLSFLPDEEVAQVVRHAANNGLRTIAALLPQSAFGTTVERSLSTSAKVYGARLASVERYDPSLADVQDAAAQIAAAARSQSIDAVMIPEGGEQLRRVGQALQGAGFSPDQVQVLGTGAWDDARIAALPIAVGGWYAGVPPETVRRFEQRYQQSYLSSPPRIASLAYDAVSLAVALAGGEPGGRFTRDSITNPEGFQGVNGLFRFRPNGLVERGLAILEVTPSGPRVIAPAPDRFGAGF